MYNKFIKKFLVTFFSVFLGIALFTLVMDPFEIYSVPLIKGLNDNKYPDQDRLLSAINIIKHKPKLIVLGTSRVRNLSSIDKYSEKGSAYNAFFPGADFNEIYAYFLHTLHVQPDLKTVIVGIDLFSFNPKRKPAVSFTPDRLFKESITIKDIKNTLISFRALINACQTLLYSALSLEKENPILQLGEKEYLKTMLANEENYKNFTVSEEKVQKFQSLVAICKQKDIDLKVFICPVKAMYWDFYFNNDLWRHVEELKKQLCAIHPIWDFSGFNPITTETLKCDESLYFECSHFTPYTGSLLLQRMFGAPSQIDDIGYLLTPDNFEEVSKAIHQQRLLWLSKTSESLSAPEE